MLLPNENSLQCQNGTHKMAEEPYLCPFLSRRREMAKLVPNKAFLQPAKATAMCTAPHAETRPPPPIPPFLLAQNLSSKQIVPTDNSRYQWLKGFNGILFYYCNTLVGQILFLFQFQLIVRFSVYPSMMVDTPCSVVQTYLYLWWTFVRSNLCVYIVSRSTWHHAALHHQYKCNVC